MLERMTFTPKSADRIASAVRKVEAGDRQNVGVSFSAAVTPEKVFRVCTFTGAWTKNTLKAVTFKYQTSTPNTVSSVNLFADVAASTATRNCAIARDGTAWHLIAAEC